MTATDRLDSLVPPGLHLVPVGPEHTERIQELCSDPLVTGPTSIPEPYPPDGAKQFVDFIVPLHAARQQLAFAIVADGVGLVGVSGIHHLDSRNLVAETGYWIGREYWGRGFATGALVLTVGAGFSELALRILTAHTLEDNTASRRVLEKVGFDFVGLGDHDVPKWPEMKRVARYQLAASQWARSGA